MYVQVYRKTSWNDGVSGSHFATSPLLSFVRARMGWVLSEVFSNASACLSVRATLDRFLFLEGQIDWRFVIAEAGHSDIKVRY